MRRSLRPYKPSLQQMPKASSSMSDFVYDPCGNRYTSSRARARYGVAPAMWVGESHGASFKIDQPPAAGVLFTPDLHSTLRSIGVDPTNSDVVFVESDQGVFVRPAWVTTSIV
jgi:hypothetical protein